MTQERPRRAAMTVLVAATLATTLAATLAACGGGGGSDPPPGPGDAERAQAARSTATGNALCTAVAPFYWELGNASGVLVSGSVDTATGAHVGADTVMNIASASKWLFGAYVAELRGGALTADDIRFLNFRSGYDNFAICLRNQTVDSCLAMGSNGDYTAADLNRFKYDGGHMQKLASNLGLGAMDNAALATELRRLLGSEIDFTYSQPQPAGGVVTNATNYARFLRKLLNNQLKLAPLLGTNAVCTNPLTCPNAIGTPVPSNESWSYSLGHWLENDPVVGDNAVSSAGAFGFYPWIDATRTLYGVLAREGAAGTGQDSAACGRLIRKAWVTAKAQ